MTVRFEIDHPSLGAWGVTLPAYKWGYVVGQEHVFRSVTVNRWGRVYRVPVAVERAHYTVTFREIDDTLDPLRQFAVLVHRYVCDVRYYPDFDTAPATYITVDWPLTVRFNRVLDNYGEVELQLDEQVG